MKPVAASTFTPNSSSKSKSRKSQPCHVCEYCKKIFSSKRCLGQHRKIHLIKSDFRCSLCDYATNFKHILISHLRVHTKEKPFKCPEPHCNSAFAQSSSLYNHRRVHKRWDESLSKFKCAVCSFKALSKAEIKSHMKVHSEVKEYKCDRCLYQSKYKSDITRHHKQVHSTVKPFKCSHSNCNYSCKFRRRLRHHMKVHSKEKPLLCSFQQCGFRTKWKEALLTHKKTHSGERRYKCSVCRVSFSDRSLLWLHSRGHKGQGEEGGSSSQNHSCSSKGDQKTLDDVTMTEVTANQDQGDSLNGVTHVQWSVDWGRLQDQPVDEKMPTSPRPVIKIEIDA